jgi:CYTH domain-containing protein
MEIEVKNQMESNEKPPWTGKNVTKDLRYNNYYLVKIYSKPCNP